MIINWLKTNYLELFSALSGLIYIFLSVRQNIWLWPLGVFTSVLQASVFLNSKLYADMSLQVYYVIISIYGWYYWFFGKQKNEKKLPVITSNSKTWVYLIIITILLFFIIHHILKKYTNSDVPVLDSFTTAASITGTWMLARKYLENWIIWIVVDIISTGLYIYKELYYLAALYFILTVMAVKGYKEWKKGLNI